MRVGGLLHSSRDAVDVAEALTLPILCCGRGSTLFLGVCVLLLSLVVVVGGGNVCSGSTSCDSFGLWLLHSTCQGHLCCCFVVIKRSVLWCLVNLMVVAILCQSGTGTH